MPPFISITDLTKSYGDVRAVNGISLEVALGELFGLIGPDGAGKTTIMRIVVTLLRPDLGEVTVNSFDTVREPGRIRAITGYMPQRFSLYPDLSIDQNLDFFADLFEVPKNEVPERKERLYTFSRLKEFSSRLAGRLSGGMKQKLALSCTLIHDPLVLILDEPTTGVDPVSRSEFWRLLHEIRERGVTILVSTPYMDEARLCDRVAVIHEGEILASGRPDELEKLITDRIFSARSSKVVMDFEKVQAIPGVTSVQSFGDSMHLAVAEDTDPDTVREQLRSMLGEEIGFDPISPSLEDVFIDLIRKRDVHA